MAMKVKFIIKKSGEVVTEVVDRGEHLCSNVYKVTNSLGKQLSDENIGPECDRVEEIQS
jgi:hypothetical protein